MELIRLIRLVAGGVRQKQNHTKLLLVGRAMRCEQINRCRLYLPLERHTGMG